LQTVKTLRVLEVEGCTLLINQSPPHLAIALFLPRSSSEMSFPSAIKAVTIALGSSFAEIRSSNSFLSLLVAFPRLTAVGRAVYR
jgi:hypothetical protein